MLKRPEPGRGGEKRYDWQEVLVDRTSENLYRICVVYKNTVL
jgi:hypothetical protein